MSVKFMKCEICGNVVEMIHDSGVVPVCCGKPMTQLKPNTSDGAGEKHVPVIEKNGDTATVKVGSVTHPMLEEHYIMWVALVQGDRVQRVALKPGQAPEATFRIEEGPLAAYEYCNLHGLWMAEA